MEFIEINRILSKSEGEGENRKHTHEKLVNAEVIRVSDIKKIRPWNAKPGDDYKGDICVISLSDSDKDTGRTKVGFVHIAENYNSIIDRINNKIMRLDGK